MGKPTDEIQARLDELGVEYDTYDLPNGEHGVSWIDGNNIEWEAVQRGENLEIHALQLVTPEQAIAATVGAGTCVDKDSDPNDFKCSACGARSYIQANDTYTTVLDDHVTILKKFNYCPNCGKRIKEEAE